jgi:hypothetical protein
VDTWQDADGNNCSYYAKQLQMPATTNANVGGPRFCSALQVPHLAVGGIDARTACCITCAPDPEKPTSQFVAASTNIIAVTENTTTYTLTLSLRSAARNVYKIFGDGDHPMLLPAAYQTAAPVGADIGGVNPGLWSGNWLSQYDSWLSVGITEGIFGDEITASGIDFSAWTEDTELSVTSGAVSWSVPEDGPIGNEIVIAQVTVSRESRFEAYVNARGQGRGIGDAVDDWQENGILFTTDKLATPLAVAHLYTNWSPEEPSDGDCVYISADGTWTTADCEQKLESICDPYPKSRPTDGWSDSRPGDGWSGKIHSYVLFLCILS